MDTNEPLQPAGAFVPDPDQRIGAILVYAGMLRGDDVEVILELQRQKGLRFGDAGLELGLLTRPDIDFALSQQFEYPYLTRGSAQVSTEVTAAYEPFGPRAEALRVLRAQLMMRWFDEHPKRSLAVISAARAEGRSYVASNLAVTFCQAGERTLLIDADLRSPRQHEIFNLMNRTGLSSILAGRARAGGEERIACIPHLSVLTAGACPPSRSGRPGRRSRWPVGTSAAA